MPSPRSAEHRHLRDLPRDSRAARHHPARENPTGAFARADEPRSARSRYEAASSQSSAPRTTVSAVNTPTPTALAMIDWLRERGQTPRQILAWLHVLDATLSETMGSLHEHPATRARLARTLFSEYAASRGVSVGEMSILLPDVEQAALETLAWIESRSALRRPISG